MDDYVVSGGTVAAWNQDPFDTGKIGEVCPEPANSTSVKKRIPCFPLKVQSIPARRPVPFPSFAERIVSHITLRLGSQYETAIENAPLLALYRNDISDLLVLSSRGSIFSDFASHGYITTAASAAASTPGSENTSPSAMTAAFMGFMRRKPTTGVSSSQNSSPIGSDPSGSVNNWSVEATASPVTAKSPPETEEDARQRVNNARDALLRYYTQLENLETHIPSLKTSPFFEFKWSEAFSSATTISETSVGFEKASVIFNLGCLFSQAGMWYAEESLELMSEETCIKNVANFFQLAAASFHLCKGKYLAVESASSLSNESEPSTPVSNNANAVSNAVASIISLAGLTSGSNKEANVGTNDLKPELLDLLSKLMTAQAQECFLVKASRDKKKASSLTRLASGARSLYQSVEEKFQSNALLKKYLPKDFVSYISLKRAYCDILCHYFAAHRDENENNLANHGIARLEQAMKVIKETKASQSNLDKTMPEFKVISDCVENYLPILQRSNETVYTQESIDFSLVPVVEPFIIVSQPDGAHLNQLKEMLKTFEEEDLFSCIVPFEVSTKISIFTEERAKIERNVKEQIETANAELETTLQTLKVHDVLKQLESSDSGKYGPSDHVIALREHALELESRGPDLETLYQRIESLSAKVSHLVDSSANLLEIEHLESHAFDQENGTIETIGNQDESFRSQADPILRELKQVRGKLSQSINGSNVIVKSKLMENSRILYALCGFKASSVFPSLPNNEPSNSFDSLRSMYPVPDVMSMLDNTSLNESPSQKRRAATEALKSAIDQLELLREKRNQLKSELSESKESDEDLEKILVTPTAKGKEEAIISERLKELEKKYLADGITPNMEAHTIGLVQLSETFAQAKDSLLQDDGLVACDRINNQLENVYHEVYLEVRKSLEAGVEFYERLLNQVEVNIFQGAQRLAVQRRQRRTEALNQDRERKARQNQLLLKSQLANYQQREQQKSSSQTLNVSIVNGGAFNPGSTPAPSPLVHSAAAPFPQTNAALLSAKEILQQQLLYYKQKSVDQNISPLPSPVIHSANTAPTISFNPTSASYNANPLPSPYQAPSFNANQQSIYNSNQQSSANSQSNFNSNQQTSSSTPSLMVNVNAQQPPLPQSHQPSPYNYNNNMTPTGYNNQSQNQYQNPTVNNGYYQGMSFPISTNQQPISQPQTPMNMVSPYAINTSVSPIGNYQQTGAFQFNANNQIAQQQVTNPQAEVKKQPQNLLD